MKVYIKFIDRINRKVVGSIRFGVSVPVELFIVPVKVARCVKFSITGIHDTRKSYAYSYKVNGKIYKRFFRRTIGPYNMSSLIHISANSIIVEIRDKSTEIKQVCPENYHGFYLYKIL